MLRMSVDTAMPVMRVRSQPRDPSRLRTRHGHNTLTPCANISARYTVVSARIASLPRPTNAMFADSTPKKNLPNSVPARSHTYSTERRYQHAHLQTEKMDMDTHVHAVAARGVYVPERVDLEAIGHAGVDVCEDPAIEQRIGARVYVEFVAVSESVPKSARVLRHVCEDTYTVAGSVVFLPKNPPAAPESAL